MKSSNPEKIEVKKSEPPVAIEIMESEILAISKAFKKLCDSRLKRETMVTLLSDTSSIPKKTIRIILNCLDQIEELYLKPIPRV